MNFRGTKPMDFVATAQYVEDSYKKSKQITLNWHNEYRWLIQKYRELEKKLNGMCEEKRSTEKATETIADDRSCLPFPKTTNDVYGWLAKRSEFQLEKYGSFVVKYHNPMDEVVTLGGDIPTLAAGKGFI